MKITAVLGVANLMLCSAAPVLASPETVPAAVTLPATNVLMDTAVLQATVNPSGSSTTAFFEYGQTPAYGNQIAALPVPGAGASAVSVSGSIGNLICGTEYHFRVVATSAAGTGTGGDVTFTAMMCPLALISTGTATAITSSAATLNGSATAISGGHRLWFEYGPTTNYERQVSATPSVLNGRGSWAPSAPVTGLNCATLYHFRLVSRTGGTGNPGGDGTFTTGPCTIDPLHNIRTAVNTPLTVNLTVGGGSGSVANLSFFGHSSNPTLVPQANLVFTGPGAIRSLVITPAANRKGATTITVISSDGTVVATTSFVLQVGSGTTAGDFDGDGRTDLSVWRPSTNIWYIRNSSAPESPTFLQWQTPGVPVPGDYDGDGKSDVAMFQPLYWDWKAWELRYSSNLPFPLLQWGLDGDVPAPADYNGDGVTDAAVFRPSTGIWYVREPIMEFLQWGLSGDLPVPADYDGDGKSDVAVYRPSTGIWYVRNSSAPDAPSFLQWGLTGDIPVPGDYNGDGVTDAAVFRPSTGIWYVLDASTHATRFYQWGWIGDIPLAGDFDGDGKADVAVFRPSTGIWYIWHVGTGTSAFFQWGLDGDVPAVKLPSVP